MASIMNTKDAVRAAYAELYATINDNRYCVAMGKTFEANMNVNTAEVPRLGNVIVGHKALNATIEWSLTLYYCTQVFVQLCEEFKKTGAMPTFTIQVSNEDPASSVGRSTMIFNDCVLDSEVLLSSFDIDGDFIEQELSGYCDDFSVAEYFSNPSYM